MLKSLAMLSLLVAFSFGWPCVAQHRQSQTHGNQNVSNAPQGELPPSQTSNYNAGAINNQQTQPHNQKDSHPPVFLPWWQTPEWVVVCITALYTLISFLTLAVIGTQVWLMRDTAQRQLRAYVVIERGIIANVANPPAGTPGERVETVARILQPQAGPTAQITIKNVGQTPAHEMVHWARICLQEFPLKSKLPTMPEREAPYWNVLGSGVPEVKTLRLPNPLGLEQIEGLRNGTLAIYCHGEITYRDVFEKRHTTKYRAMYCFHCGVIGIATDLIYCDDGNEAT